MATTTPKHDDGTPDDADPTVSDTPDHPTETAEGTDTNADVPSISPSIREQIKYGPDGTVGVAGGAYIDSDPNLPQAEVE